MSPSISRKYTSGSNSFSSQAPNFSASSDVMTLKSKQSPHTTRSTDLTPSTPFRSSRTDSNATCAETRLALPASSSSHLQRHSRAMVSYSTPSAIWAWHSVARRCVAPTVNGGEENAFRNKAQGVSQLQLSDNVDGSKQLNVLMPKR